MKLLILTLFLSFGFTLANSSTKSKGEDFHLHILDTEGVDFSLHRTLLPPSWFKPSSYQVWASKQDWRDYFKRHAIQFYEMASNKNWDKLADYIYGMQDYAEFPGKCRPYDLVKSGDFIAEKKFKDLFIGLGFTDEDFKEAAELRENAIFVLIVKLVMKDKPKDEQKKAVDVIIQAMKKNKNQVQETIRTNNWKIIIHLLTKETKKKGIVIDLNDIFEGDCVDHSKLWRTLVIEWSNVYHGNLSISCQ